MCENGTQHRFQAGSMSFFKSQAPRSKNTNIAHSQSGRGWNAFQQYSKVSWLKITNCRNFFWYGPGKVFLAPIKTWPRRNSWTRHRLGRRLCLILVRKQLIIDRFPNFWFCRINFFLFLTHFPDDVTWQKNEREISHQRQLDAGTFVR